MLKLRLAFLYIKKARNLWFRAFYENQCGEEGIRTPETFSRLHAFQACLLSHSSTSPLFYNKIAKVVKYVAVLINIYCIKRK